jgi:hypothetical protein
MHLALLISRIRLLPTAMPSTRSASASRLLVRADNSPGEVKARFSAPFVSAYLSPLFSAPLLSSKFRSALLCYLLHQLLQRIKFRCTTNVRWWMPSWCPTLTDHLLYAWPRYTDLVWREQNFRSLPFLLSLRIERDEWECRTDASEFNFLEFCSNFNCELNLPTLLRNPRPEYQ